MNKRITLPWNIPWLLFFFFFEKKGGARVGKKKKRKRKEKGQERGRGRGKGKETKSYHLQGMEVYIQYRFLWKIKKIDVTYSVQSIIQFIV